MDDGALEEAEKLTHEARDICGSLPPSVAEEVLVWCWLLIAEIEVERRRDPEALEAFAMLERLAPGDGEALYLQARLRMLRWEFGASADLLADIEEPEEIIGSVRYAQAMLREFAHDFKAAARLYQEAAALDPEHCPLPQRIETDEVLELLDGIVRDMPEDVRGALENVTFDIVDLPERKLDGAPHNPPTMLGLYTGDPIDESSASVQCLPHSIRVFRRNIERIAADREHLLEELRLTILHEIGHHLGWDEDELEERGLA
ncbi:MAG: metallopeptidase family protein [Planctomycetes bacterium]|nr:metallopeptidase family protein [Planctomycetota bacterium]